MKIYLVMKVIIVKEVMTCEVSPVAMFVLSAFLRPPGAELPMTWDPWAWIKNY